MYKSIITLALLLTSVLLFSQESNLSTFVDEQSQKLVYSPDKLVQAPNTNVSLIPPEYFVADPAINGFVHAGSACTIQVIEVPGVSYNIIEASMTPEYIASQNYTYIDKSSLVTQTNKDGVIYFVTFSSGEIEYERAMFFTGDQNTIWVNVNYPVSMKKLIYPAVEACFKSVQ
jgi:hypothetical protein